MDLLLVGFSHKNAPAEVREALARLKGSEVLERLRAENCPEAVVLSTCNRFEIYLINKESVQSAHWVSAFLEKLSGASLQAHAYHHAGVRAVRHLFEVACGLDSLVVGETEILGQVKAAYEQSLACRMTGKGTNVLFQRALYVGKLVRNETGIAVGQTSVASVAVQMAESIFGDLKKSEVLVLGAGLMAELTAKHLLSKKISRLTIANRTFERAEELASRFNGHPLEWERFPEYLDRADVVIASTGADHAVLTKEAVSSALGRRAGRSLFIIDIAMPRAVEESVHGLDQVYLYRLEDLEAIVAQNLKNRGGEISAAQELVARKAAEFSSWADAVAAGREMSLRHSSAGVS